jgi:UDPglucose 6-dehydrogenase
MDPRIGPDFLYAGMGYGGSCFPKDVKALIKTASDHKKELHLLTATEKVNEEQKNVLFTKLVRFFGGENNLNGKTIALWGLSFKPNTDDMREAPSRILVKSLFDAGANVVAYDPVASTEAKRVLVAEHGEELCNARLRIVESAKQAVEGADVLVLVTEWKEFRAPDLPFLAENLKLKAVFDGRNIYDPDAFGAAGLVYEGIGRRSGKVEQ